MEEKSLWESISESCDAELRNKATLAQKELLQSNVDLHVEILKLKKKEIECQFVSHKAMMHEYHMDYVSGDLTKTVYFECISDEKMWRSKAVSYLTRIEVKLLELKSLQCITRNNEMTS